MDTTLILNGFLLGWFLATFTPIQIFLEVFVKPYMPWWLNFIKTGLSCHMCLAMWITFGLSFDLLTAIAASCLAFSFQKIMNGIKTYL